MPADAAAPAAPSAKRAEKSLLREAAAAALGGTLHAVVNDCFMPAMIMR